jgi:hypothetical protein
MHVYITWKEDNMKQLTPQVWSLRKEVFTAEKPRFVVQQGEWLWVRETSCFDWMPTTNISHVSHSSCWTTKQGSFSWATKWDSSSRHDDDSLQQTHVSVELILSIIYVIWVFIKLVYVIRILWIINKYLGAFQLRLRNKDKLLYVCPIVLLSGYSIILIWNLELVIFSNMHMYVIKIFLCFYNSDDKGTHTTQFRKT